MLTRHHQNRIRLLQLADAGLFAIALLAGYYARASFPWLDLPALEPVGEYLWMLPVVALLGPAVLASQGFYQPARAPTRLETILAIARSCTFTVIGLVVFLFIARTQLARSVIIMVGVLGGLMVYARYELVAWLSQRAFAQSELRRRALWIGRADANRELRASLTRLEQTSLEDCGECDPAGRAEAELSALVHERSPNVVILNLAGLTRAETATVLRVCDREGLEVLLRPGLAALPAPRLVVDQFGGEPVFYYRAQAAAPAHLALKQAFDYAAAVVLLVLLSPVLLVLALLVGLSSPGGVVYRQQRAGLNGWPFQMLKFRSMRAGAETQQTELREQHELTGPAFKLAHDPRITPVGRFLRRHSLDELPQLWNVLRGEMSLVGPRPLPVSEVKRFENDAYRRRLSVKPGLTGLWQISGRSDIGDFEDWVRLDLTYIDQWSPWLDCRILLATIPAVLFGRGAR